MTAISVPLWADTAAFIGFPIVFLTLVAFALCRAAALGDKQLSLPPAHMAGDGAQAPPGGLSSASADEAMRSWDIEAELAGMDWWPR